MHPVKIKKSLISLISIELHSSSNLITMLKKVVISPTGKDKAIAFFEEISRKKEEAKKKIAARTEEVKDILKKTQASQTTK